MFSEGRRLGGVPRVDRDATDELSTTCGTGVTSAISLVEMSKVRAKLHSGVEGALDVRVLPRTGAPRTRSEAQRA